MSKPGVLRDLDQDTLIGLVNSLYDQNRQLSELLQQFLREKYGRKTERFVDSGQLTLFDTEQQEHIEQSSDAPKPSIKSRQRDRNPRPSNITRFEPR